MKERLTKDETAALCAATGASERQVKSWGLREVWLVRLRLELSQRFGGNAQIVDRIVEAAQRMKPPLPCWMVATENGRVRFVPEKVDVLAVALDRRGGVVVAEVKP